MTRPRQLTGHSLGTFTISVPGKLPRHKEPHRTLDLARREGRLVRVGGKLCKDTNGPRSSAVQHGTGKRQDKRRTRVFSGDPLKHIVHERVEDPLRPVGDARIGVYLSEH